MTFSQKNLNPNETIALDMHPHWWYFSGPVMALVVSIIGGTWALTTDGDGNVGKAMRVVFLAALVITAIWVVVRYLKWMTTNFVITSHRLIFRTGVVAQKGIEIPLERAPLCAEQLQRGIAGVLLAIRRFDPVIRHAMETGEVDLDLAREEEPSAPADDEHESPPVPDVGRILDLANEAGGLDTLDKLLGGDGASAVEA
jgi:hypothetical protein